MKVSEQLLKGVRMAAPNAPTHDELRTLASKTRFHSCNCKCEDCGRFTQAMNLTKDTTTPTVSTKLAASFKSLVHDSGGRVKPVGHTVKVPDEAGATPPKKRKRVSEALADSLLGKLR